MSSPSPTESAAAPAASAAAAAPSAAAWKRKEKRKASADKKERERIEYELERAATPPLAQLEEWRVRHPVTKRSFRGTDDTPFECHSCGEYVRGSGTYDPALVPCIRCKTPVCAKCDMRRHRCACCGSAIPSGCVKCTSMIPKFSGEENPFMDTKSLSELAPGNAVCTTCASRPDFLGQRTLQKMASIVDTKHTESAAAARAACEFFECEACEDVVPSCDMDHTRPYKCIYCVDLRPIDVETHLHTWLIRQRIKRLRVTVEFSGYDAVRDLNIL